MCTIANKLYVVLFNRPNSVLSIIESEGLFHAHSQLTSCEDPPISAYMSSYAASQASTIPHHPIMGTQPANIMLVMRPTAQNQPCSFPAVQNRKQA